MKQEILRILTKNSGYVSGEEISNILKVSRTAVWKHIKTLRREGYVIESQPRLGYRLILEPDLLLPEQIKSKLNADFMGKKIFYYDTVTSTNDEAKRIASLGFDEGTVVIAEQQTGGRGRRGRCWLSPKHEGIWVSIILKPSISPVNAPKLTMLAAVSIVKAIKEVTGLSTGIKWPNDILYNNKKIVGILTELSAEIDLINYIILGMGINVNTESFPDELKEIATSLKIETGKKVDRVKLLCRLLELFEQDYKEFLEAGFSNILNKWRKYSITLGKKVRVIGLDTSLEGEAVDVTDDGALIIKKPDGNTVEVLSGDVSIR
ncbi:MAG: BirA family transcriptional regulator [Thermosediminibacterales bacterium]|nr:BirA family transcriptional regulator [Thermosediminibacterales bacterium]MDK2836431.1 BirA family transcriptional regulator [Thermosediminibacterales bacterium]